MTNLVAEQGQNLLQRLTTLDISTICEASALPLKAPPVATQASEVLQTWRSVVAGPALDARLAGPGAESPTTFAEVAARADRLLRRSAIDAERSEEGERSVGLSLAERELLQRIQSEGTRAAAILERVGGREAPAPLAPHRHDERALGIRDTVEVHLDPAKLRPDDVMFFRKNWEVRTASIAARTTVSLSGDITSWISSDPAEGTRGELLALHQQMVDASLGQWAFLMTTVSQFISTLAGFFFGSLRRSAHGS